MPYEKNQQGFLSRRSFLVHVTGLALGAAAVSFSPSLSLAKVSGRRTPGRRTLSFYHTHTLKELDITYALGRTYNPRALRQINSYLGDFRTGESHPIDPKLLDILWIIQKEMGRNGVYEVISGYRSPRTNARLRRQSFGVAEHSLHMQGKAIDVRFPGIDTEHIRECAVELRCGGVGYYAKSDFVHLDTGQYRTW